MAYTPTTWQTGDIVSSVKLNKLETGVKDARDALATQGSALETKAEIDGNYPNMTVGNAGQLVATVGIEDKAPYLFRTSGGAADIGDRETDTVVGGSVAWNQLIVPQSRSQSNGVTIEKVNDSTMRVYGTPLNGNAWQNLDQTAKTITGHVYFVDKGSNSTDFGISNDTRGVVTGTTSRTTVGKATEEKNVYVLVPVGTTVDESFSPTMVDLTQMFGSTIADYIYTLESGAAGAGVAWLKKYCPKMFSTYQPYNAGELLSVKTSAHETVGFNAWDEEWEVGGIDSTTGQNTTDSTRIRCKNYIPVLPDTTYCFSVAGTSQSKAVFYYDANKGFISYGWTNSLTFSIPSGAYYIRFYLIPQYGTTYNHDICINLHWDGERDGEYEPYVKHTYPLDSDLELRGIPKLDAGNNLYYDGDTYQSDGTVTRRYAAVDIGTLSWSYSDSRVAFNVAVSDIKQKSSSSDTSNMVCGLYVTEKPVSSASYASSKPNMTVFQQTGNATVFIRDERYTDAATFKTAMSGVYLVYELATPTTESADPFQNPQIVDDFGTESYADSRTIPVPVGHTTTYSPNLRAKLEMAPDSPSDGDGDYIVRQTSGENEYVKLVKELPTLPTTDGTYTLTCTVASGTPTLSWVANE